MLDTALRIADLIGKYNSGDISLQESIELETWRAGSPDNQELFEDLTDPLGMQEQMQQLYAYERNADAVLQRIIVGKSKPKVVWLSRKRMIAVAAAMLLVVGGIYVWNALKGNGRSVYEALNKLPEHNKAKLTFHNGKSIQLQQADVGVVELLASSRVRKPRNGEVVYETLGGPGTLLIDRLETPAGGQQVITLEDSTRIFLNALSELRFPEKFARDKRIIWFSGEGYFEVKKDSARPFIIMVNDQEVRVTGTKFVINAYNDEAYVKTTVVEGSVSVRVQTSVINVKAGQAVKCDKTTHKLIPQADTVAARAFINGEFIMNGLTIGEIMRQLCRWYNVEVQYAAGYNAEETFVSGTFEKSQTLPGIIKILNELGAGVRMEQKKLIVDYP